MELFMKLLIVDDETPTREGLKKHIPWELLGISIVKEARDGYEALEIIANWQPDFMLTDVRMPGMDGIELASRVRKLHPSCYILFLSGYSDKEYLKSAIDLNAVSYIEKPINLSEVTQSVQKAISLFEDEKERVEREKFLNDSLEENLPYRKEKLAHALLNPKSDPKLIKRELNACSITTEPGLVYQTIIIRTDALEIWNNPDISFIKSEIKNILTEVMLVRWVLCSDKDDRHIISILAFDSSLSNNLEISLNSAMDILHSTFHESLQLFISVGQKVNSVIDIPASYRTAVISLQKLFFRGYGKVVFIKSASIGNEFVLDEEWENDFNYLLEQMNTLDAIQMIRRLCAEIKPKEDTLVSYIKNIFFRILLSINSLYERRNISENSEKPQENYLWDIISGFETLDEIQDYISGYINSFDEKIKALQNSKRTIVEITRFIEKNYSNEALTTQSIAENVYLTPTYLCALFKKETGRTIREYITTVRMEKSKQLLLDRKIKLHEIAKMTGYSDSNYYAKVFKRSFGLNPSEYRENFLL